MGYRWEPDAIVADGKRRTLTRHAQERVSERKIEISWIVDVLENWVARRWNEEGQRYYRHGRGETSYFDEVRDVPQS